jgi:hypothetical protein
MGLRYNVAKKAWFGLNLDLTTILRLSPGWLVLDEIDFMLRWIWA